MARTTILIAAFTVLAWYLWPLPCSARPRYFDAFKRKYAPNPGNDFGRLVDTSKCFVCHPNKETKKERNHYGEALEKFLGKNEKNKANIDKALRDTEKLRSPRGKTYESSRANFLAVEPIAPLLPQISAKMTCPALATRWRFIFSTRPSAGASNVTPLPYSLTESFG